MNEFFSCNIHSSYVKLQTSLIKYQFNGRNSRQSLGNVVICLMVFTEKHHVLCVRGRVCALKWVFIIFTSSTVPLACDWWSGQCASVDKTSRLLWAPILVLYKSWLFFRLSSTESQKIPGLELVDPIQHISLPTVHQIEWAIGRNIRYGPPLIKHVLLFAIPWLHGVLHILQIITTRGIYASSSSVKQRYLNIYRVDGFIPNCHVCHHKAL